MILNSRIIPHQQGVTLVDALVSYARHSTQPEQRDLTVRRVEELFRRESHDNAVKSLGTLFAGMKLLKIGVDHQMVEDEFDNWENDQHRAELLRQFFLSLNHGGAGRGQGRKARWNEPTTTIAVRCPVSRADELRAIIAEKLATFEQAKTPE